MSNSRSRSPYQDIRATSNSPMRLMEKQKHNSHMLLNANSFSNVKSQDSATGQGRKMLDSSSHIQWRPNMRESIQESGLYPQSQNNIKGYQAELKLTEKYAARFGMDESDQHHSANHLSHHNNYASFQSRHSGNNYMMHLQH